MHVHIYPCTLPLEQKGKSILMPLRNSGGIIMFIDNNITKGVTKVSARANSGGDAIWVKLDRSFIGTNNHIFQCGGYIVPRADKDHFEILRKEIEHFSNQGKVCILGDLNARTASLQPHQYILDLEDDHDIVSTLPAMSRNSMDKKGQS